MTDFCILYKRQNYQKLASSCLSILLAKALYTMRPVKLKLHGPFILPASPKALYCLSPRRPSHYTHLTEPGAPHRGGTGSGHSRVLVWAGKMTALRQMAYQKVKHHKNHTQS